MRNTAVVTAKCPDWRPGAGVGASRGRRNESLGLDPASVVDHAPSSSSPASALTDEVESVLANTSNFRINGYTGVPPESSGGSNARAAQRVASGSAWAEVTYGFDPLH